MLVGQDRIGAQGLRKSAGAESDLPSTRQVERDPPTIIGPVETDLLVLDPFPRDGVDRRVVRLAPTVSAFDAVDGSHHRHGDVPNCGIR